MFGIYFLSLQNQLETYSVHREQRRVGISEFVCIRDTIRTKYGQDCEQHLYKIPIDYEGNAAKKLDN